MKKKVLFLLHLPPPVHGSSIVGRYVFESKLINSYFNTKYINLGTSDRVDEIGKGGLKKIIKYVQIIFQTIYQLIVFKPKVGYIAMTAKGGAFYKDVLIAFLMKFFGVKLVIHLHNKGVSVNQNKRIDNFLYKRVFSNSKVILLSKYLYSDIQKYVSTDDVYFCPNGIPNEKLEVIKRKDKEQIQLLFLSNLIESKGVFVLLEALSVLKNKNTNFKCTFIGGEGDVSSEKFHLKVKEYALENHAEYLGKKYGKEKHNYFLNADIFVFPTYYHNETFGLVNLEAMQYSLPIISTFEGGIPDVVENGTTGFLVKEKDVNELVKKLELLISNKDLRRRMGSNGYKRYLEKFTIERFEENMLHILSDA